MLNSRSDLLWTEQGIYIHVEERFSLIKARMVVALDGAVLFSKGGPVNPAQPQPTPIEIEELMDEMVPEYPYTEEDRTIIDNLHVKQVSIHLQIQLNTVPGQCVKMRKIRQRSQN